MRTFPWLELAHLTEKLNGALDSQLVVGQIKLLVRRVEIVIWQSKAHKNHRCAARNRTTRLSEWTHPRADR